MPLDPQHHLEVMGSTAQHSQVEAALGSQGTTVLEACMPSLPQNWEENRGLTADPRLLYVPLMSPVK